MIHWTTFVLILVAILVLGFVAMMAIAAKLEIENKRSAAIKALADTHKNIQEIKKAYKKSTRRGGHLD